MKAIPPPQHHRRKERSTWRTTFLMADDRLACLPIADDPLASVGEYLAVAELGGSTSTEHNDVIYLAAALSSAVS